ncbi:hypothetical protein D3C84_1074640 [compost metagenome]
MHDVADAHQAALEPPAVHRSRHPWLVPEQAAHQRHHQQHRDKHTADVKPQVVAAGLTEQRHRRRGQPHGQHQENQGNNQRTAARLLSIGLGILRLDFEHRDRVPWGMDKKDGQALSPLRGI